MRFAATVLAWPFDVVPRSTLRSIPRRLTAWNGAASDRRRPAAASPIWPWSRRRDRPISFTSPPPPEAFSRASTREFLSSRFSITPGAMMSTGAIAVAPSNPTVVWVGTGEADNRQSSSWGDGVYKSLDAGATWQKMGLADTRHIAKIVIHPTDPNTVYIAAAGHLWGSNAERGVFKTIDGGKTWKKVLYQRREHRSDRPGDGSRRIPKCFTPRCISISARAGATTAAARAAEFFEPWTAARPGRN